jgi:hypothetical protein
MRGVVIQRQQRFLGRLVVRARFEAQGALANGGENRFERQHLRDPAGQSEAAESGLCEDDRVVLALVQLSQSRVHVAANVFHLQIGTGMQQLSASAEAARGDRCTPG